MEQDGGRRPVECGMQKKGCETAGFPVERTFGAAGGSGRIKGQGPAGEDPAFKVKRSKSCERKVEERWDEEGGVRED